MKKVLVLSFFLIASCGVQKKNAKDPYVGNYDFTIFAVDNYGDIPIKLSVTKEGEKYSSTMVMQSKDQSAAADFEVETTTLDEGVFTIEAYAGGYDIYFELTIEGDELSGSMMGMFDVEGSRIKE